MMFDAFGKEIGVMWMHFFFVFLVFINKFVAQELPVFSKERLSKLNNPVKDDKEKGGMVNRGCDNTSKLWK